MVKQMKFRWFWLLLMLSGLSLPWHPERRLSGQTRHRFGGLWHHHRSL